MQREDTRKKLRLLKFFRWLLLSYLKLLMATSVSLDSASNPSHDLSRALPTTANTKQDLQDGPETGGPSYGRDFSVAHSFAPKSDLTKPSLKEMRQKYKQTTGEDKSLGQQPLSPLNAQLAPNYNNPIPEKLRGYPQFEKCGYPQDEQIVFGVKSYAPYKAELQTTPSSTSSFGQRADSSSVQKGMHNRSSSGVEVDFISDAQKSDETTFQVYEKGMRKPQISYQDATFLQSQSSSEPREIARTFEPQSCLNDQIAPSSAQRLAGQPPQNLPKKDKISIITPTLVNQLINQAVEKSAQPKTEDQPEQKGNSYSSSIHSLSHHIFYPQKITTLDRFETAAVKARDFSSGQTEESPQPNREWDLQRDTQPVQQRMLKSVNEQPRQKFPSPQKTTPSLNTKQQRISAPTSTAGNKKGKRSGNTNGFSSVSNESCRSFFSLQKQSSKKRHESEEHGAIPGSPKHLEKWFERLSVQERITCLTTTYPYFCSQLVETFQDMCHRGCLSLYHKAQGPASTSTQGVQSSGYRQEPSYTRFQGQQPYGAQKGAFGRNPEFSENAQLFTLVLPEETYGRMGVFEIRDVHNQFFDKIRLTDYRKEHDTLTVSPEFVEEPTRFFEIMHGVTRGEAFQKSIQISNKTGRAMIDPPQWSQTQNQRYLAEWIAAIFEETLWAHYNVATGQNIMPNVRKNELSNLFETRSESLQSPEDLAKRWDEMGEKGRKKLIEALTLKAKEHPKGSFEQTDDREQFRYGQQAYNGMPYTHDSLMRMLGGDHHYGAPRYGYYDIQEVPVRPHAVRMASDMFFLDQDSAFAKQQHNDTDLKEVCDFVNFKTQDGKKRSSLEIITFLSETPLRDMQPGFLNARKTFLMRELHIMIQENLRNSIQQQLMGNAVRDPSLSSPTETLEAQTTKTSPGTTTKVKAVQNISSAFVSNSFATENVTQQQTPTERLRKKNKKKKDQPSVEPQLILQTQPEHQQHSGGKKKKKKTQQQEKPTEEQEVSEKEDKQTLNSLNSDVIEAKESKKDLETQKQPCKETESKKKQTQKRHQKTGQQKKSKPASSKEETDQAEDITKAEEKPVEIAVAAPIVVEQPTEAQLVEHPETMSKKTKKQIELQFEKVKDTKELRASKKQHQQQEEEDLPKQNSLEKEEVEVEQNSETPELEAVNSKKKRNRKKGKKNDAETLVNSFMRRLHGEDDEAKIQETKVIRSSSKTDTGRRRSRNRGKGDQKKGKLEDPQHWRKTNRTDKLESPRSPFSQADRKKTGRRKRKGSRQRQTEAESFSNGTSVTVERTFDGKERTSQSVQRKSEEDTDEPQVGEQVIAAPEGRRIASTSASGDELQVLRRGSTSSAQSLKQDQTQKGLISEDTPVIGPSIQQYDEVESPSEQEPQTLELVEEPVSSLSTNAVSFTPMGTYVETSLLEPQPVMNQYMHMQNAPFYQKQHYSIQNQKTSKQSYQQTMSSQKLHNESQYQGSNHVSQHGIKKFNSEVGPRDPSDMLEFGNTPFHGGQMINKKPIFKQNVSYAQKNHSYQVVQPYAKQFAQYEERGDIHHNNTAPIRLNAPSFNPTDSNSAEKWSRHSFQSSNTSPAQPQMWQPSVQKSQNYTPQPYNKRPSLLEHHMSQDPSVGWGQKQHVSEPDFQYDNYQNQNMQAMFLGTQVSSANPYAPNVQQNPYLNTVRENSSTDRSTGSMLQRDSPYSGNESTILTMEEDPLYAEVENAFYVKFDKEIAGFTDMINRTVSKYAKERELVHEKVKDICSKAFTKEKPRVEVFGSLQTGLALKTSDMDMVVTGLQIDDRTVMIEYLHAIADDLNEWDLVTDLKVIDTASIPVIKAHVNLRKLREKEFGKIDSSSTDSEGEGISSMLPIDITIDDLTPSMGQYLNSYQYCNYSQSYFDPSGQQKIHLGIASCGLMKDYVTKYPFLREVSILLKSMLLKHDLNNAYLGGMSCYSAVLLVVAYMNHFRLHLSANLTPSRLLMGFLDFYSNFFNPKLYGVNTINEMSFFPLSQLGQQHLSIVDPVNPANNTARTSYRAAEVLASFRTAFACLKLTIKQQYLEKARRRQMGQSASDGQEPQLLRNPKGAGAKAQQKIQPIDAQLRSKEGSSLGGQALDGTPDAKALPFSITNFVDAFLACDKHVEESVSSGFSR